jgi:hypothetical protein
MLDINTEGLKIEDLEIIQLGYVYKDIKKQAEIMERVWGMPKFGFLPDITTEIIYRGEKSTHIVKIALSRYFGKQIELIQPISGKGIHQEFLDNGHEGLQHLSCIVEDLDPYIDLFKKQNIELLHIGQYATQYVAYFDTKDTLGFILEIQMIKKKKRK